MCVLTRRCDERALMRDSYYVGLIILVVREGDCQPRPQLFIKATKYGPGLRRVYMCVYVCVCTCVCVLMGRVSQPFVVTSAFSHFQILQDIYI